jgi:hypothetical protein
MEDDEAETRKFPSIKETNGQNKYAIQSQRTTILTIFGSHVD